MTPSEDPTVVRQWRPQAPPVPGVHDVRRDPLGDYRDRPVPFACGWRLEPGDAACPMDAMHVQDGAPPASWSLSPRRSQGSN